MNKRGLNGSGSISKRRWGERPREPLKPKARAAREDARPTKKFQTDPLPVEPMICLDDDDLATFHAIAMNMRPIIFALAIFTLISPLQNTRADVSDWFVVLDSTNGFYASPGVPEHAVAALRQAQQDNVQMNSFAFTPSGEWVLLEEKGFQASSPDMTGYPQFKKSIKCAAFSASGPWVILYRGNGFWGPGSTAWVKVKELLHDGHKVRSVSFGTNDGFVILYDQTGIRYGGIPSDLTKVLDNAVSNSVPIQCVAFSGRDWICLAHDDWWTSNPNLPASKFINESFKAGQHPKWIAFVPQLEHFNPEKFAEIIRQRNVGVCLGGYECVVINHGKLVLSLADGWARAPWEKTDPAVKMTANTHMEIASLSKTITAVAMLKLCEECAGTSRQFSLDEPFWPHIRELCPNVNEDVKKITIRQVMMHRGGFTNDFGNNPKALRKLLALPLPYPPGTHFEYRNVNYYIIHLLIEQISQMDCTTYVRTHVLIPMGITDMDSRYHDKPNILCYGKAGSQDFGADIYHGNNSSFVGPSGWYGSAMDLGIFLEGIRQCRVLSPATTAMMFKENLGWDWGSPRGPWGKGGLVPGPNESCLKGSIIYCPDGVDIAILMNCHGIMGDIVQAWKDSRY